MVWKPDWNMFVREEKVRSEIFSIDFMPKVVFLDLRLHTYTKHGKKTHQIPFRKNISRNNSTVLSN